MSLMAASPIPLPLERGAFCVSIDVERLWGVWDVLTERDRRHASLEGPILEELVQLLDEYGVPATFALVGRLLDDSPGFDGLTGPASHWHAPETLELLRSSATDHEIGTHTHAHPYFHQISEAAARRDLERARDLHARLGLPFESLVFPRNQVAHLEVLAELGLRVFRSVDAGWLMRCERRAPRLRPAANLIDKALAIPAPLVTPLLHPKGLVELPSSTLLMGRNGLRAAIHPALVRRKLSSGLRRAAEARQLFHLWFHPSNFYFDARTQFAALEAALREAAALRDAGRLELRTMGSFAAGPAAGA